MKFINTFFIFPVLIIISSCSQNTRLVSFEKNGFWGYKNEKNMVIIPPKYIVVNEFLDTGIAAVADSSGWAYIDTKGQIIIRPYIFDNGPDDFVEGLARYQSGGKFGFFDQEGTIIIPAQWDFARPFSNGMAAVCEGCEILREDEHILVVGGKWGFVNHQGNISVPIQFDEVKNYEQNKTQIKINDSWKVIDKSGTFIQLKE